MAKKPESRLQKRIHKALKARWPKSWWVKFHGGVFSAAGVPDLLGCVNGQFFAFEVKCPGKLRTLTPIQAQVIYQLQRAGACASAITSVEEALALVEAIAPPPARWRELQSKTERIISSVRAADGKDMVRWGIHLAARQSIGLDRGVQEQPAVDVGKIPF